MLEFARRPRKNVPLDLVIYDDLFPYKVSGFRIAELETYLKLSSSIKVCTTLSSLTWLNVNQSANSVVSDWKKSKSGPLGKQLSLIASVSEIPLTRSIYSIFLNNIFDAIEEIEQRDIDFAFTLYPGGGFALHNYDSDHKLERVLKSPKLFKVIATQPVTLEYLRKKFPFSLEKVEYIFGGVLPTARVSTARDASDELQIAFVANKYHPKGLDKGFDLFVDAMNELANFGCNFSAHIIGPWDLKDIENNKRVKQFIFHGVVASTLLQGFLSNFDVAVFPTRSNELGNGTFDGFPTGSAIEAGLAGCVVLTTNPLKQECPLEHDKDYFLIEESVSSIVERILELDSDRETLNHIKKHCSRGFLNVFSLESQMERRIKLIKELMQRSTYGQ